MHTEAQDDRAEETGGRRGGQGPEEQSPEATDRIQSSLSVQRETAEDNQEQEGAPLAVLVTQPCPTLCDPMDCSQTSLSIAFSRQEYWSGLPFPSPEELPNPGVKPCSPTLQAYSLPFELQGSPTYLVGDPVF